jgi:membrane protease YdiL (CAAX protease family)
MGVLFEPLILYIILFFPGALNRASPPEPLVFSAGRELSRIFMYNLPALALIWHLLLRRGASPVRKIPAIRRGDLYSALLALPGLLLTGFCVSMTADLFYEMQGQMQIEAPAGSMGWIVMILSCISTGYLEESFFRFYLFEKLETAGLGPLRIIFVSTALFAVCHLYEGPWGVLNAVLAGAVLAVVFSRFRSLHGIALAHGLYNIFVYAMGG